MLESVLAESEEGCVKNRSFERERLSGADLSEAEFERVRFKKCVFEGCRFSSSAFYGAVYLFCLLLKPLFLTNCFCCGFLKTNPFLFKTLFLALVFAFFQALLNSIKHGTTSKSGKR